RRGIERTELGKERQGGMVVGDLMASSRWLDPSTDTLKWLASLLRDEGLDLMAATTSELERGTPVYVEADADLDEVQRRMARNHIRRLPVVDNGHLVGVIDLVDLALRQAKS
ncbi:MAG: CBS domain-containing protein, partial [Actinomycetota bacterium]